VRYRGINKNGTAITGQAAVADVAEFVDDYYRRGFRELTVYEVIDGEEVIRGEIAPGSESGRRSWWAEGSGEEPAHDPDCQCEGRGVCRYWNTVPRGARAE